MISDRTIALSIFGVITGAVLSDKSKLYQEYVTDRPEVAAPLFTGSVLAADYAYRTLTEDGSQTPSET